MGQQFADQYSLLHYAVGVLAYFWGIGFLAAMVIHTVFEWVENTPTGMRFINKNLHGIWPGGKPAADAFQNCVGDTVFFAMGWISAQLLDAAGVSNKWY